MTQEELKQLAESEFPFIKNSHDDINKVTVWAQETFIKGYQLAKEEMFTEDEVLSLMMEARESFLDALRGHCDLLTCEEILKEHNKIQAQLTNKPKK